MISASGTPTVVFDLGEVLIPSTGLHPALAAELGVGEPDLRRAYWAHRERHDRGMPPPEYWTAVFADLGLQPDRARMERAEALDVRRWSTLPASSSVMIGELARARVRMTILSNAPRGLAAAVRAAAWSGPFYRLLFSADVGVCKPSPDIYARADHAYRTRPDQVVFFDDRPDNVRAARAHGWDAHVWRGIPTAMATLRGLGISTAGGPSEAPPDGQG